METVLDFIKRYAGIAGLLGMSLVQLLNLQPSPQSLVIFIAFTSLAVLAMIDWLAILRARRHVRRGGDLVWEPAYGRRARRAAIVALALTPPMYAVLTLSYHIPNTWPILINAGVERRMASAWLKTVPGRSLLGLPDEAVAPLFVPGDEFAISEQVQYIAVTNRSTLASPPLQLRLVLHPLQGAVEPPAQPYVVAVAAPAAHAWRPLGRLLEQILPRAFSGTIIARAPRPDWISYRGLCGGPAGDSAWCFTEFPRFPVTRSTWHEPELRLPSIPSRGSLEVYLELAFRMEHPEIIPMTIILRQVADGPFPVHIREDLELQAGASRR